MITTFSKVPDRDVAAFIDAENNAGYSMTALEQNAIETFVKTLKRNGLWKRMGDYAIYPMVGDTADSQKFNLLNPLDTDGAFRLTYYGSPIHSSLGVKGNGTNQYVDTHINLRILGADPKNVSMSAWAQESTAYYTMGAYDGGNWGLALAPRYTDDKMWYIIGKAWDFINTPTTYMYGIPITDGSQLFSITVNTYPNQQAYRNGVLLDDHFIAPQYLPAENITIIGVGRSGGFRQYSPNTVSYASLLAGLTTSEALIHSNAVTTLMTTLDRL
jgi:hypothetical protein